LLCSINICRYFSILFWCKATKKKNLPVGLSLDLWAMLPTVWSQLETNAKEQNPNGEASQIPCFFMAPEGSSPYSQKLTVYSCSEHEQLSPSPLYMCSTVAPAASALYTTSYLQLYPLTRSDSLTYKKNSVPG
jgi:hypothetical protein